MTRLRKRRSRRSGAMLTLMAVVLIGLLGLAAVAVDLSNLYFRRAELQIAATAAAAGGAIQLPDTQSAASVAIQLAQANMPTSVHGQVLVGSDVIAGNWDFDSSTFTPGGTPLNAVRATTRRSAARGNPVGWLFASIFGMAAVDLRADAVAALLPHLPGALGGVGSVDITGNVSIDSYHSGDGPYDSQTPGTNGDVSSQGPVTVGGNATINGDVHGGAVSTGGSSSVSGDMSPRRRPMDMPAVDVTGVSTNNDNDTLPLIDQGGTQVSPLDGSRNFLLTGGVVYDIPPGEYYFNDMTLTGQSTLNVSGPTTIYLTGDLDTSGGDVINATEDPNNLRILMTGGTAVLSASVDWYGLLYAPNTDVTIEGTADIYGAVVGQTITAAGTGDIHFDEDLSVDDVISFSNHSAIVD